MATLFSVKKRAESKSFQFVFFFALLLSSGGTGWLVWSYAQRWDLALYTGGAAAILFSTWWFLVQWQTSITWLCNLQLTLAKLNLLPKDYAFWDDASPLGVQTRIDAAVKAALETVQGREKEIVAGRHTLEKYLGSDASRQAKGSNTSLGGQVQKVFILFSDIRGFTKMSEQLTPQETMRVLNQIYTALGLAIEVQGGEINKFIGDAILAYFKRSGENEKADAQKAIRAALDMQEKFGKAVKSSNELTSKSISIGLGIGIVAGEALMGNLGSRNRMEFTLIGDAVNLASRLCSIAPEWEILVNEELAMMVSDQFHIESRQPVQLKGKTEKVTPYSIMGDMSSRNSAHVF
jgi:class 3 adenylate cyclase